MASIIRIGISRLINNNGRNCAKTSIRLISGKNLRCLEKSTKPKPWPYHNKGYTILNYFFDKTTARFDENSKVNCLLNIIEYY